MKKICLIAILIFTANIFSAQSKKEKKFEESSSNIPNNSLQIQMNKYYDDTKSIILSHEKALGTENLNMMLNFNKKEYSNAVKSNNYTQFLSREAMQANNLVYSTNLISKLDSYKTNVLEKLDEVLAAKQN